jgi:hypothetical protein
MAKLAPASMKELLQKLEPLMERIMAQQLEGQKAELVKAVGEKLDGSVVGPLIYKIIKKK